MLAQLTRDKHDRDDPPPPPPQDSKKQHAMHFTFRVERIIFSATLRCPSSLRPMSRGACDGPRERDRDPPVRVTTLSDRFA